MERNIVTRHFSEERADRATYIARTVGFGTTVAYMQRDYGTSRYAIHELMETGVVIIRNGNSGAIVTMYIASFEQVNQIYQSNHKKVPEWMRKKAYNNKKKGYLAGQPKDD